MKLRGLIWILFGLILVSSIGLAETNLDLSKLKFGQKPSKQQIVDGLREALEVGADHAVKITGCQDGYLGNPAIKIPIPEKLKKMEDILRQVGYSEKVDQFVVSMNRAAEKAAPAAKEIFGDAIKGISFDDARKILTGNDTAATEYFKVKTYHQLAAAFKPAVTQATNEVGVTRLYKELTAKAKTVPYVKIDLVDIDQYVVTKAMDGLFLIVGEEERKIRKDPLARVTELLKLVFGSI